MSSEQELAKTCDELLKLAKSPLQEPFYLVTLTVLIGLSLGAVCFCLGIEGVNFVLFSALVVGCIYARTLNETVPIKMCLKTTIYYYMYAIIAVPCVAIFKPEALFFETTGMLCFLIALVFVEGIVFSALLVWGSHLYLSTESKKLSHS